jgi:flagellin
MELRISSNYASRQAVLGINQNLSDLSTALERLSSGRRINRASDSPATLVISEHLKAQIASLNQEIDNISDNINKYETASSNVLQLREQLNDLRSLAIGAANSGGNSEDAQKAYVAAADSVVRTYNSTAARATYNGSNLLDGSKGSSADVSALENIDMSTPEAAAASIEAIDEAAGKLDEALAEIGSAQKSDLESRRTSLQITRENLIAAESTLADADYAQEAMNYTASLIRSQAAVSILSHSFLNGPSVVSLLTQ